MAKKKTKKSLTKGQCHIQASFGNTFITITDLNGAAVAWSSAGHMGFKGGKKGTPFAAQVAMEDILKKIQPMGLQSVEVFIKGPGAGREAAARSLISSGLRVTSLRDVTPVPHNGCRPPKRRRV